MVAVNLPAGWCDGIETEPLFDLEPVETEDELKSSKEKECAS